MANTIVPSAKMLNPERIDVANNWHQLNTTHWAKNYNLITELQETTGYGNYYAREKSFKKLWDLLTYCSNEDAIYIIRFFGLPDDTLNFLRWVWDEVAVKDDTWKWEVERKPEQEAWEDLLPSMDWFPYDYLYKLYKAL